MFALIQIKYQNWPGHEMVILSIAFYFKDYFPHTSNKSNISFPWGLLYQVARKEYVI